MEFSAHKPIYHLAENVEIDTLRACLRQHDNEHYLRQQAFDVLVYLVEQRQKVVSKDELNQKIWKDTAVTDAALSQCIFEVRKALGDDCREPRFIKTIPKLGYRFIGCVEECWNPVSMAVAKEAKLAAPLEARVEAVAKAAVETSTELVCAAHRLRLVNGTGSVWMMLRRPLTAKPALITSLLAAIILLCGASWVLYRPATTQAATAAHRLQNRSFATQTGTFTAFFDAMPPDSPINSTVGLSNGAATCNKQMAAIARFNPMGSIDARNGGLYAAASTIPYAAGVTYHFRMVVNVRAHTYSLYVTPEGGAEQTVGTGFAFRSGQNNIPNLNSLGIWGANAASVSKFSIAQGT